MKNPLIILVSLLVLLAFIGYMTTYTVTFTQTAIVSTLGKVDETSGVIDEPGLKFRLPAPIQSVTVYDKRPRLFKSQLETFQTADEKQVVLQCFVAWKVADPVKFFRSFNTGTSDAENHYRQAQDTLRGPLRNAMSEVGRYTLDQLFDTRRGDNVITELENAIQQKLESPDSAGSGAASSYGIEIALVGINRINFPEQTTQSIFDAMQAERQGIATAAREEGNAIAAAIRSQGETQASQILSFADLLAAQIRAQGDIEAAQWLSVQRSAPELAVFLREVELMKEAFAAKVTVVMKNDMFGARLFNDQYLEDLREANGGDADE